MILNDARPVRTSLEAYRFWWMTYRPCVHVFYLFATVQDVAGISLHFFARFFGSYSRLQVQLYFSTSVLQAHQRELDGLQRLLDDRDERLKVIPKESNQLMNAQQTIEEDNQWDWVVRDWMDV